jgi:hypothetical protein
MRKLIYLSNWVLDKNIPNEERWVELSIHLNYPDSNDLCQYSPSERIKKTNQYLKKAFNKLIETKLFSEYELIGSNKRPTGIRAKIKYTTLTQLEELDYISYVSIHKIDKAKEKKNRSIQNFYCVKMTVAIEIEGKRKGFQSFEERFVLIKAKSFEDAYKKIEAQKADYEQVYLNPYGQLVRWKIESLDDCYITDMTKLSDFNAPEGVEVYSILKTRRLNQERFWNGKTD